MKISTKQEASFVDSFIEVPTTELDTLQNIVDWAQISKVLNKVQGDYEPVSLFKILLLQVWNNMSDTAVARGKYFDIV